MVIEKLKPSVHSDHKFRFFTFNDRESEILFQHSPLTITVRLLMIPLYLHKSCSIFSDITFIDA